MSGAIVSVRQTHGVGSYSQALLNEPLEGGLQDLVLVGDRLLHDLLSGDRLQRLKGLKQGQKSNVGNDFERFLLHVGCDEDVVCKGLYFVSRLSLLTGGQTPKKDLCHGF